MLRYDFKLELEVLHLYLELRESGEKLRCNIVTIETAIDEILGSKSLKRVFHLALAVGNVLNEVRHITLSLSSLPSPSHPPHIQ